MRVFANEETQRVAQEMEVAKSERVTRRSLSELVQRQSRFVFRIAYAMLRNVQDAEDVVQEVFLKLFRSGAWEEMRDERAFLARTAWRMAVDHLPKRNAVNFQVKKRAGDECAIALAPSRWQWMRMR